MNISQILTKLKSLVYSKSEADTLLSSKASSSHKHTKSEITDFPTIPSKTSQLTNDSGFLTSHQSLANYSTLANTVKSLAISGKTITVTPGSGNAYTLTTQDTVYTHPTTAGNKHIPSGGSANQYLKYSESGTAVWANLPTIPSNTNQLTNGAGFITSSGSCNYANYSGYVQGDKGTGLYVNSVKYGNALVTTNQSAFGAIWNAPTKNYRVACATYPNSNDDVYLCYSLTNSNVSSSTNSVSRSCVWNADTGILSATGFSGSLTGNVTGNCSGSAGSVAWGNVSGRPTIPTKTSQLTNDSGFLTSHQSLSNYSTLANTVKSLSISGKTITVTPGSGKAYTLTTQDTTYSHPTSSGNKHIPSGGSSGQFLGWSADGTAKWVNNPNTNTWTAMKGATSSANGSVGYVNAVPPKDGYNTKYLRADGTWQVPPDHTYTVNNATLTIQKNGSNVATFTSNASSNVTANISVPSKTSQLTNDSGFLTSHQDLSGYVPRSGGAVISGHLCKDNDNDLLIIAGGTSWGNSGSITLFGRNSIEATNRGMTRIMPHNGEKSQPMQMYPVGTWTWTGQAVQLISDARLKQQIAEIDDKLLDAWEDVELSQFKYNDAVNEKGKDKARLHTGYVVQQIDTACKSHGVDISAYGLYCHEEYPEETEEVEVEQEDGTKVKERKVIREANEHYSLRYTEVYAVECMYLRRCIARLTARIEELEKGNTE